MQLSVDPVAALRALSVPFSFPSIIMADLPPAVPSHCGISKQPYPGTFGRAVGCLTGLAGRVTKVSAVEQTKTGKKVAKVVMQGPDGHSAMVG